VSDPRLAPRLRRLPRAAVLGREVRVAAGFRARLLGLAGLDREEAGPGLLIPRCSSVHTFAMRFALDLYFIDGAGAVVCAGRGIPGGSVVLCRGASSVLEVPAEQGGEIRSPEP
jgi:uncharacterized protein